MILGQSAAIAACKAIDADQAVQDIPYETLKEKLLERGQVLTLPLVPAWNKTVIPSMRL